MARETVKCPSCGSDNERSSRFCVQCGRALKGKAEGAAEPEPHESPDVPQPSTEDILRQVTEESGYEHSETEAGWRMVVPLGEERRQKVHVVFSGRDDEGQDVVSFLSVCGPATDRDAATLLRLNGKMTYGAFAIRTIQGSEYFVVTANRLARSEDPGEIRRLLLEVAKRADAVESQLSGGRDVY